MGEMGMYTNSLNISQNVINVRTKGLRKCNRSIKERDINSNWVNLSKQINSTAGAIKCDFKKKNTLVLIAVSVIRQVAKKCFLQYQVVSQDYHF